MEGERPRLDALALRLPAPDAQEEHPPPALSHGPGCRPRMNVRLWRRCPFPSFDPGHGSRSPSMHRILIVLSCTAFLLGCYSVAARDEVHEGAATAAWNMKGWRIIGCCCTAPCACRINKKPSYCHGCDHTDVVHIEQGEMGGVKMDGVQWTVVGRGFGQGTDANWAYVYVDDRVSEAQYKALGDWLSAGVAGLGKKAPYLAGNFKGMRKVPMTTNVSRDK